MITRVYLSLGSNQGNRLAFINAAVEELRKLGRLQVSKPYLSEPQGFDSGDGFVNICAALDLDTSSPFGEAEAIAFLDATQAIERRISSMPHRNADGSYRNREIDIDIIEVEGFILNHPRLTLPHPRAKERDFVQIPLLEVKN